MGIPTAREGGNPETAGGAGGYRFTAALFFLLNGFGFGLWAALIADFKSRLGLAEIGLSYVLLAIIAGALTGMPLTGRIVAHVGSRSMLRVLAPLYGLTILGPLLAPSLGWAILAAFLFGMGKGSMDVTVNSHAIVIEKLAGRPIMSSFQGMWSIGGLTAAVAAGTASGIGIGGQVFAGAGAVGLILVALVRSGHLYRDAVPPATGSSRGMGKGFALPLPVLAIGALAFVSFFCEGTMTDWSAVYARDVAGAADWQAPFAYGVFSCAMAVGRLSGDFLNARLGSVRLLRLCGILAASGIGLTAAVPWWPVTYAGLLVAGLGVANLVPLFISAVGRLNPDGISRAVAAVTTIGYIGFLVEPPVVGYVSSFSSLAAAFTLVAFLGLLIALFGPFALTMKTSHPS